MRIATTSAWLIGDALGQVPVLIDLAKREQARGDHLRVLLKANPHPEFDGVDRQRQIVQMIPQAYGIEEVHEIPDGAEVIDLSVDAAFGYSIHTQRHMTTAYHHMADLMEPQARAIRPEIDLGVDLPRIQYIDYAISPHSRSLPPSERWPREKWQAVVDAMPDRYFVLFAGNGDDPGFIRGKNAITLFGAPLRVAFSYLPDLRYGLLSVVNGLSHAAFATSTRNFLLYGQGCPWGLNPEAVLLGPGAGGPAIPDVTVDAVVSLLRSRE